MFHRLTPLPCPALFFLLWFFSTAPRVYAHGLEARLSLQADGKVQVQSWFSTDQPAAGARVQVFRKDGRLLTEGKTDDKGVFLFTPEKFEVLRVVVSSEGHQAERWLQGSLDQREPASLIRDIVAGVALVLAVAAFGLGLRNARKIKENQRNAREIAG